MNENNFENDSQGFDSRAGAGGTTALSQGSEGGSQSSTRSANAPTTVEFSIPEEYKEKGWTKFFDGKSGEELKTELFRSYDNSQTLMGKKVEDYIKTTDLKSLDNYEEIKEALTKQIGNSTEIPENTQDYELSSLLTNDKGEKILTIEDKALTFFGDKFKELGFSKEQAQNLFQSYVKFGIDEFHRFTNADELEKSIKTMFNETTSEKSQQRKTVEGLIKEFLPKEDQQIIQDSVPNKVVEMFYKVAKGLVEKYDFKEGSANSTNPAKIRMSEADKNAEYDRLYNRLLELDNSPHQKVGEREEIVKRMREIFQ